MVAIQLENERIIKSSLSRYSMASELLFEKQCHSKNFYSCFFHLNSIEVMNEWGGKAEEMIKKARKNNYQG
jgi:hypothetical protein